MSAHGSPRVYRFQTVQDSSISVTVSVRGAAGPAFQEQLMDRLQGVIGSPLPPGAFPPERGDDGVERGYMINGREVDHVVMQSPTGDNPPVPDKDELYLSHGHQNYGKLDVEMTNPQESFSREAGPPDSTTYQTEALVADLRSQITGLTAKNDELSRSVKEAADNNVEIMEAFNRAVSDRDELVRIRQSNQTKIKRLNDMIIKNSQKSDEPLDEVMQQETYKIRNMATEVIKRHFPGEAKFRVDTLNRLDEYFRHFYDVRMRRNYPEGRRRLLIALLFEDMQRWFFGANAKRFGLPTEMEKQLQQFEKQIEQSNKVDIEEALEWRTRTVSYAGRLNLNNSDIVSHATHQIAANLGPMILLRGKDKHGNSDKKDVVDLENSIFELCSASLKLALRFRSSKTKYEFKTFPDDTCQTAFELDPDLVKPMDTEGPISRPLAQNRRFLFCTLWGALVKTRPPVSGESGERVVLEPAQVILYEPDLWDKAS